MSSFCICKSYSHFLSKTTCELDIVLTRTVDILTTNDTIKLTMFWTTGPWYNIVQWTCSNFYVKYWKELRCWNTKGKYNIWDIKSIEYCKQLYFLEWFCLFLQKTQSGYPLEATLKSPSNEYSQCLCIEIKYQYFLVVSHTQKQTFLNP